MVFRRLRNLAARRTGRDPSPVDGPAVLVGVADLEEVAGPPPILRPAAIFRQVLFDPADLVPVWARPRAAAWTLTSSLSGAPVDAAAVTTPDLPGEPKPAKRARRSATTTSSSAVRPRSKKAAKPSPRAIDD